MSAKRRLEKEIASLLDSRQLLWFKRLHPVWGFFYGSECIGWFKGYHAAGERSWPLLLGTGRNGVLWLEVQGERSEYGGLPELVEALEAIRDSLQLTLDPFHV